MADNKENIENQKEAEVKDNTQEFIDQQTQKLLKDGVIINKEDRDKLDQKIDELRKFLDENDNKNHTFTEDEKTKVYRKSTELWNEFKEVIDDLTFNFYLNKQEFKFIKETIFKKLEYGEQDLFVALNLDDTFFKEVDPPQTDSYEGEVYVLPMSVIMVMYHLLGKYTVYGIQSNESKNFASVLRKIGDIGRIYNYYDGISRQLSNEIYEWSVGLDSDKNQQRENQQNQKNEQ